MHGWFVDCLVRRHTIPFLQVFMTPLFDYNQKNEVTFDN